MFIHSKAAKYDENKIVGVLCHSVEIIQPEMKQLFSVWAKQSLTPQTGFSIGKHQSATLTPREKDILFFLAKAKTAKQIAHLLKVSPRTVYSHMEHIKTKLNCHTKSELVDMAYHTGLAFELPSDFLPLPPCNAQ
jgi:DNA-binding CsgD family transcriptional regulator